MISGYWQQVVADGHKVPLDRPLNDLTAELCLMLGDPSPAVREEIAVSTLATWIHAGIYDDLLAGLGDGLAQGTVYRLGRRDDDSVLRRSFSALLLAEVIERDNQQSLLRRDVVLGWGDRITAWLVRERDTRGFVPGIGWLHAVAHGADAIAALARSPHVTAPELTVLLDVVADRLVEPTPDFFFSGEADRLALAVMQVLRRDLLAVPLVEAWLNRLATHATPGGSYSVHPFKVSGFVQDFLRALHVQLALSHPQPEQRSDLLLALVGQLIATNPAYLRRRR